MQCNSTTLLTAIEAESRERRRIRRLTSASKTPPSNYSGRQMHPRRHGYISPVAAPCSEDAMYSLQRTMHQINHALQSFIQESMTHELAPRSNKQRVPNTGIIMQTKIAN